MNKLELDLNLINAHWCYCKDNILPNLKNSAINKHKKIKDYLDFCIENYETLIKGTPKELREFQKKLENKLGDSFQNYKKNHIKRNEKNNVEMIFGYKKFLDKKISNHELKKIKRIFDENCEISDKVIKGRSWNPYVFLFLNKQRICPYCNRQYITPVLNDFKSSKYKSKMRADLDHFWPKHLYPHFSMSIYNLVPSCKFCNSSLKGGKELPFDTLSPYEIAYNDLFKFIISYGEMNDVSIDVEVIKSDIKDVLDIFSIKDMYKYHDDIALDFVRKRVAYSDVLINKMIRILGNKIRDVNSDEIKSLILGFPVSNEDIDRNTLGKLKRDLAIDVGFI